VPPVTICFTANPNLASRRASFSVLGVTRQHRHASSLVYALQRLLLQQCLAGSRRSDQLHAPDSLLPISFTQLFSENLIFVRTFFSLRLGSFLHFQVRDVQLFAARALSRKLTALRALWIMVPHTEFIFTLGTSLPSRD
jgi:hypothetical protein